MNIDDLLQSVISSVTGLPLNSKVVSDIAKETKANVEKCFLCQGETHNVGVFFPHKPKEFWAPEDKNRVVFYGLCDTCFKKPNKEDEVEFKLRMTL